MKNLLCKIYRNLKFSSPYKYQMEKLTNERQIITTKYTGNTEGDIILSVPSVGSVVI
jgi:hypothetical protein